jgi:hypothetical protein
MHFASCKTLLPYDSPAGGHNTYMNVTAIENLIYATFNEHKINHMLYQGRRESTDEPSGRMRRQKFRGGMFYIFFFCLLLVKSKFVSANPLHIL